MALKEIPFSFKPKRSGLKKVLGDLEAEIMEIIWKQDEVTVRYVYEELRRKRDIAYTTVMTTMGILADKGILTKNKTNSAYLYKSTCTKEEFSQKIVGQVVNSLMDGFAEPLLAHFVNLVNKEDNRAAVSIEKLLEKEGLGEAKDAS